MNDRDIFGVGSGDSVQSRQFTDTKGGDHGSYALDTGVSICSVSSVQLVDASDPVQARLWQIIESDKVVVSRNTVDTSNTDLVQATEKVSALGVSSAHDFQSFESVLTRRRRRALSATGLGSLEPLWKSGG